MPEERGAFRRPPHAVDPRLRTAIDRVVRRPGVIDEVVRPPRDVDPGRPSRPPRRRPPRRPDEVDVPTDVEVAFDAPQLQALFRKAGGRSVVWVGPPGELEVRPAKTRIVIKPGVVLVAIAVKTDQTGAQEMVVPLMVGTEAAHLGLAMGAQRRVIGESRLAAAWSDALTAQAWSTLLSIGATAIERAAAARGRKDDSVETRPGAMFTRGEELVIRNRRQISAADAFGSGR